MPYKVTLQPSGHAFDVPEGEEALSAQFGLRRDLIR